LNVTIEEVCDAIREGNSFLPWREISCKYFNFFLFSVLVRKCKEYMCYFLVHYCTRKLAISHPMKFEDLGQFKWQMQLFYEPIAYFHILFFFLFCENSLRNINFQ
jgi:hypothetical protein